MNKAKNSRILKSFTVFTLSTSFILGSLGHGSNVSKAVSYSKVEDILASLTAEQRAALNQLSTSEETGLKLSSDIDLGSSNEINVIVEFSNNPVKVAQIEAGVVGKQLTESEATNLVDQDHVMFNEYIQQLKDENNSKVVYKISHSYKHAFNGVSLSLPANQIKNLLKSKAVKNVWSNETFSIEPPAIEKGQIKADGVSIENYSPYDGLDRLHEEGFTGKGIKVGILDTGIDYNHPDLKDAYKGGYDFVNNDSDPMETTYADWKKSGKPETSGSSKYYTEHGTHVAGIIAGRGKANSEYKTVGAAPEADVYAYRVLGPYGSGSTEAIIAGIDRAVQDGMNVINMSLGAVINDPLNATSIAVNHAVISGVTTVVSAGNSGDKMYTLGSPGSAALVLTVGASSIAIELYQYKGIQNGVNYSIRQLARNYKDDLTALKGKTYQLVDVGLGNPADFNGKDLNGKIAFIKRGSFALIDKIKNARAKGAAGVLMYNDEANKAEGAIQVFLGESVDAIPAFSVSNEAGTEILAAIKAGKTDFTFGDYSKIETNGDELAGFSSRGPSRVNYDIKPEVTGPGVSILSTVPFYINDKNVDGSKPEDYQYAYERLSGTSMSAPYVAGVSALLLQSDHALQPADVKTILMNTADPLSKDYSVFEAGSGRIDAYEAIHSNVEFQVVDKTRMYMNEKEKLTEDLTGGISFGTYGSSDEDISDFRHITVENRTKQDKTFSVNVKFQTGLRGSMDSAKNNVTLEGPTSVKIDGNSQRAIKFDLHIPKTAELGTYEGFIVFTNDEDPSEQYQIPFGGRVVSEGIDTFTLRNPVFSNKISDKLFAYPFMDGAVSIKSHMKTLDVVLQDPKTGEDLGLIGSFNPIVMDENQVYNIPRLVAGVYYPFTDDKKNPISSEDKVIRPGHYILKLVGTNESGKTFTAKQDFVLEYAPPTVTSSFDSLDQKVIEYNDSQLDSNGEFLYDFKINVNDPEIDEAQNYGIPIDQSNNSIVIRYNSPYPYAPIRTDKNGDYVDQILIRSKYTTLPVSFYALDAGKNQSRIIDLVFTKNTTPYYYLKANKDTVSTGDTINYSVRSNNIKHLKTTKMTMEVVNYLGTVENVVVSEDVKKYGDAQISVSSTSVSADVTQYTFTFTYLGNNPLPEDLKLFNFDLKTLDKNFTDKSSIIFVNSSTIDNQNVETKNVFTYTDSYRVNPKISQLTGAVQAEGAKDPITGQAISLIDHRTLGTKITLTSYDGNNVLETRVSTKGGEYTFNGVKVDNNSYTIKVDIPGHFTMYKTLNYLSDEIRGEQIGRFLRDSLHVAKAGDVNKDHVIDVLDAIELQKNWGTNNVDSDLNFDKIVDKKDMDFIVKNYGLQNNTVSNAPNPKTFYKGDSLDTVLSNVGLK